MTITIEQLAIFAMASLVAYLFWQFRGLRNDFRIAVGRFQDSMKADNELLISIQKKADSELAAHAVDVTEFRGRMDLIEKSLYRHSPQQQGDEMPVKQFRTASEFRRFVEGAN